MIQRDGRAGITMSEEANVEVNHNFLKYAMYCNIAIMLLIISQGITGLGRLGYTFDGMNLDSSHKYTAHLGLLITIGMLVLVIMSKHDGKLKGMAIGMFMMWFVQFGIGEMLGSMQWLGMVHAPLAMMMFAHGAMMGQKFNQLSD